NCGRRPFGVVAQSVQAVRAGIIAHGSTCLAGKDHFFCLPWDHHRSTAFHVASGAGTFSASGSVTFLCVGIAHLPGALYFHVVRDLTFSFVVGPTEVDPLTSAFPACRIQLNESCADDLDGLLLDGNLARIIALPQEHADHSVNKDTIP
ncbi:MAG: hypothetical protein ACNA8P_01885, partial [Phycisphaerales bacterium]